MKPTRLFVYAVAVLSFAFLNGKARATDQASDEILQNELDKPSVMRNTYSMKRRLELSDKKMATEFNPKLMANDFTR